MIHPLFINKLDTLIMHPYESYARCPYIAIFTFAARVTQKEQYCLYT